MRSATSIQHKKRLRTNKSSAHPTSPTAAAPPPPPPLPSLRVQDCSFVQWDVSGVCAVAAHPSGAYLVCARLNGLVELRARALAWAVVAALPSDPSPACAVSALAFTPCAAFVLAARLDGSLAVLAVSRETLATRVTLHPGGGAVWDVAPLAAGAWALACDDGRVRFVEPPPPEEGPESHRSHPALPPDPAAYVVRSSEAVAARALAVAAAPGAECVVVGDSEGGVRWIDVKSGRVLTRGKVAPVRRETAAIWTIQFVRGGREVVCGDSRGMATVWASATGVMRQEVRVEGLQSALWSSAVVRDAAGEELVFFGCAAGGVGALRPAEDGVWAPLRGTRFHSHDVRGMAAFEGGVVSASLDARMCVFAPADFVDRRDVTWVLPYHGCVGQPPVQFSRQARFILARRMRGIDLWGLPEDTASPPLKLRMNLKSFRGEVSACAISAGGHMIAVAGLDAFRLYQVWDGVGSAPDSPSFGKVKPLDVPVRVERLLSAAWDLAFCGAALVCIVQSKMSLAVYQDGQVMVIKKEEVGSTAFSLERIACVNGGVGVADSRGHVFYARLAPEWANGDVQLKWTRVFKPEDDKVVAVSAMSFAPSGTSLAIATSALKVFIARTEEADADADTDADKMVSAGSFSGVITSVSFADKEESVLVSGEKFCSVMCTTPSWRKRKHDKDAQTPGFEPYALRVGDSILGTCVLSSSRIVVVRRRWDLVQYSESLPDAIPKKPFGH